MLHTAHETTTLGTTNRVLGNTRCNKHQSMTRCCVCEAFQAFPGAEAPIYLFNLFTTCLAFPRRPGGCLLRGFAILTRPASFLCLLCPSPPVVRPRCFSLSLSAAAHVSVRTWSGQYAANKKISSTTYKHCACMCLVYQCIIRMGAGLYSAGGDLTNHHTRTNKKHEFSMGWEYRSSTLGARKPRPCPSFLARLPVLSDRRPASRGSPRARSRPTTAPGNLTTIIFFNALRR